MKRTYRCLRNKTKESNNYHIDTYIKIQLSLKERHETPTIDDNKEDNNNYSSGNSRLMFNERLTD